MTSSTVRASSQRDDLTKLSRYEMSIERSLRRALLDLERRQTQRIANDDVDRILSSADSRRSRSD
jgi:hypothetical protein